MATAYLSSKPHLDHPRYQTHARNEHVRQNAESLQLTTVSLLPKYTGVFGGCFTRFALWLEILFRDFGRQEVHERLGNQPVFISGAQQYITGLSAMKQPVADGVVQVLNVFFFEVYVGQ